LEELQLVARSDQEERVAELDRLLLEIGAESFALAPDRRELEAVLLAEREIRNALPDEPRAGIERRLDDAETVGLEHVVGGLAVALDLELLQTAQHVEILLPALDQQQVAALQRQIGLGHDRQLAFPKEREQAEVERVREAAAGERAAGERRVARHANDEDALLQPIDSA